MEFMEAWKAARKEGLTKEEFLPVWENDSKLRLMREENQLLASRQRQQSQEIAVVSNGDNLEAKMNSLFRQLEQESQNIRNDLKVMFEEKLQEIKACISGQLEEHRDTILNQTLVKEKFFEFSKALNHFLTTKMDSNNEKTANLVVEKMKATYQSNKLKGKTANTPMPTNQEAAATHETIPKYVEGDEADSPEERIRKSQFQREGKIELKLRPGFTTYWPAADGWTEVVATKRDSSKDDTPRDLVPFQRDKAGLHEEKPVASLPGMGPHAKAISQMLSRAESRARMNTLFEAEPERSPSVYYIPPEKANFEISKCSEMVKTHSDVFTEFLYTRPRACKVRIRLWFNNTGRLGVHLLVADGIFDEHHNWPIVFQGVGQIYNFGSKTYSKLWEIRSEVCKRPPQGSELTLGAFVCLSTNRHVHNAVTYKLLESKHYKNDDDTLLFKWDLRAIEQARAESSRITFPTKNETGWAFPAA